MNAIEYLINARSLAHGQAYSPGDWNVGAPQVDSDPRFGRQTRLTLTPKLGSGKYGNFTFHYDKTNFANLGTIKYPDPPPTRQQLLDFLSAVYGVDVLQSDFNASFAGALNSQILYGVSNFTAHPDSILFTGTLVVDCALAEIT